MDIPQPVTGTVNEVDTGLECLVLLLHFHGVAADAAQIRHRFGSVPIDTNAMLRCARVQAQGPRRDCGLATAFKVVAACYC